jgi:hypothetical protein
MISMMAAAQSDENARIAGLVRRNPGLERALQKFSFPKVARLLAGLTTLPENQPADLRLTAMIHMAALFCAGDQEPPLAQLRRWLNDIILKDPVAQDEDPVEDVFISNVVTWFGNARLFDGGWPDNDYALQAFLTCIVQLRKEPWVLAVERSVTALLKMSEAVAERASLPRFTLADTLPRQPLRVAQNSVYPTADYVTFTPNELAAMGIARRDLTPFEFVPEFREALAKETIGHTALERHPIVFSEGRIILLLPTAVSAAARRYVLERAVAAGKLPLLQELLAKCQFDEVRHLGLGRWGIRDLEPEEMPTPHEIIGQFDEGAYAHVVFLPDSLEAVLKDGLQSLEEIPDVFIARLEKVAAEIAARPGYQRGMTVCVHGGNGRGFALGFHEEPPPLWQRLVLGAADFMRLAWDTEMNALRAWKLLEQEDELHKRNIEFMNPNGFTNLYGYAELEDYELVPNAMAQGMLMLQTNYLTPVRQRLRTSIDNHAAVVKPSRAFLSVQRQTTSGYFQQVKLLPVYISAGHAASGALLGCVETASRPWWVRCNERPGDGQARSVVYQVWDLVQSWLVRVAPLLEAKLTTLPAGPITIQLLFPDIEAFTARRGESPDPSVGPAVVIEEGQIDITCSAAYLRCFAKPKNIGDRMMVEALLRAGHLLAGASHDDDVVDELASQIISNDDARFFHAIPANTARERLYATLPQVNPRLVQPEDRGAGWLDLAREAGWDKPAGPVPDDQAGSLLNNAVKIIWNRVKARLLTLERQSVIERAIGNDYAIYRDRATWQLTAAALLSLYEDQADVVAGANQREGQRGLAALASRVIAEMAVCVSPVGKGRQCSTADLDYLVANVSILLECSSQSDAIHYRLSSRPLVIEPNGTFTFDTTFQQALHAPYMHSHGERGFRAAAASYGDAFKDRDGEVKTLDPKYETAFLDEFGLSPRQLMEFTFRMADASIRARQETFVLPRSEVEEHLKQVGVARSGLAYEALTLKPRARWDDPKPKNAKPRDWYPWRFNRRLSLMRRALVQLEDVTDPRVLIAPALLDRSVEYLVGSYSGRLPVDLFESTSMRAWIGAAVDKEGHEFNHDVAARFKELGFEARPVDGAWRYVSHGGRRCAGLESRHWNCLRDRMQAAPVCAHCRRDRRAVTGIHGRSSAGRGPHANSKACRPHCLPSQRAPCPFESDRYPSRQDRAPLGARDRLSRPHAVLGGRRQVGRRNCRYFNSSYGHLAARGRLTPLEACSDRTPKCAPMSRNTFPDDFQLFAPVRRLWGAPNASKQWRTERRSVALPRGIEPLFQP